MNAGLTQEQVDAHNALVDKGFTKMNKYLRVGIQKPVPRWNLVARRRLHLGTQCYKKAVEIIPENPSTMAVLGKAYQRLGKMEEAFAWLSRAFEIAPEDAEIGLEAGVAALRLGQSYHAVRFLEAAILHLNGSDNFSYLALAYLLAGQDGKARETAEKAVNFDSNRGFAEMTRNLIHGVILGVVNRPKQVA